MTVDAPPATPADDPKATHEASSPETGPPGGSLVRVVALSTSTQLAARVVHLGLNVVSTLAIIRYLAPAAYGDYVLVLTTTLLVGLFADFGLTKLAVREIAQDQRDEHDVLGTVVVLRVVLAVVAIGVTQLVLLLLSVPPEVHLAAFVASGLYLGEALLAVEVAFHVRVQQQYEALIRVGMELFETLLLLWLIRRQAPLPMLFVPPVLAASLGAVFAVAATRRAYGLRLRVQRSRVRPLLKEALPIGPALLVGVIYLKLDGLVLAVLGSPRDVGLYGSAYQPIEYVFLASAVVINVIFPLLATAWGTGDRERFVTLYRRTTETLVAAMLLVAVVVLVAGEPMLVLLYGAEYADAIGPLRVLAVALVLMTVNGWQSFVLLAGGRQGVTLRYNLAALPIAAISCVVFIEWLGLVGAAVAALTTAVFVLVASTSAVRRELHVSLAAGPVARIVVAAAGLVATLVVAAAVGVPWPGVLVIAFAAYPAWLAGLGVVSPSQFRAVAAALASRGRHHGEVAA